MSELDDVTVPTRRDEFSRITTLAVEAGATEPGDGNAGAGGRVVLTLVSGGGAWEVEVDGRIVGNHPTRVTLRFGGDSECENAIEALEFAARTLREQWSS